MEVTEEKEISQTDTETLSTMRILLFHLAASRVGGGNVDFASW